MNPLDFFFDPILRPSTVGSMFMCFSSALVGVLVYLRKRSLIGETLSHAAFPGVVLGALFFSPFSILLGGFCSAYLGLIFLNKMENRLKVKADTALCFILASFFGVGILIASYLQQKSPLGYKQALVFLYGQAATMTHIHMVIYGLFSLGILFFILIFFRYLEAVSFDPLFAETVGIRSRSLDKLMFFLIVLAIIVGIRSVGVILMAGMLIGPAVAARPWTNKLSNLLSIAGVFGLLSGFLGNYFSVVIPKGNFSLPTGPTILMTSSIFCFLSLLFAPKNGLLIRYFRMRYFRFQCTVENSLKSLWKEKKSGSSFPKPVFRKMRKKGWVDEKGVLTQQGKIAAEKIIRLHRLWEVYLVNYMGQNVEKVHRTAEELEHLFSPDLEKQLSELLHNPRRDPHHQPIPQGSV